MNNLFDKFEKVPDSFMSEIKVDDEKVKESEASIFEAGNTAKASTLSTDTDSNTSQNNPKPKTSLGTVAGEKGAKLAVGLIDAIFPAVLVYIFDIAGYNLSKKEIQLSSSEKDALIPAMKGVLDAININLNNPFINLAFCMSLVYGIRITEALPNIKKKGKVVKMSASKQAEENDSDDGLDDVQKAVKRKEEKEKKRLEMIAKCKSYATMEERITYIMSIRNETKQDAIDWYNKNVNQKQQSKETFQL